MLKGNCHCKTVHWTYAAEIESVTACSCTLCRRYGALWAYGFLDEGISVSGPTTKYVHEKGISGYHFCSRCGCLAYYLVNEKDAEGKRKIAVNLRMIDDFKQVENLRIDHFDGFDTFEDLPSDGKTIKDLWF